MSAYRWWSPATWCREPHRGQVCCRPPEHDGDHASPSPCPGEWSRVRLRWSR